MSRIWFIADLDRDGKLNHFEFTIAMHLIKNCVKGLILDGPVNPFKIFPQETDAIRIYKESITMFDKEFLLKQNNRLDWESGYDSKPDALTCEPLIKDFFGETKILPPGNETVNEGGNRTNFNELRNSSVVNDNSDVDSCPMVAMKKHTETISQEKIAKNEENFDLENIFETIHEENVGELSNVHDFILPPLTRFVDNERNDVDFQSVSPHCHKRTYVEKDLIFEDPVGSETIGDVEFEVDFNNIINEIEKENVDEEQWLPIARILSTYKSPVYDERPNIIPLTAFDRPVELDMEDVKVNKISINGDSSNDRTDLAKKSCSRKKVSVVNVTKQNKVVMHNHEQDRHKVLHNDLADKSKDQNNAVVQEKIDRNLIVKNNGMQNIDEFFEKRSEDSIFTLYKEGSLDSDKTYSKYDKNCDKSELTKLREVEEKEKRLLERIKFLEKKRKLLYEEKQRDLGLKRDEQKRLSLPNLNEEKSYLTIAKHPATANDIWSDNVQQEKSEVVTDEKQKPSEALPVKMKTETESQKQREVSLQKVERKNLDDEKKFKEEKDAAEERRRNFLKNQQLLKQRIDNEQKEKVNDLTINETESSDAKRKESFNVDSVNAQNSIQHSQYLGDDNENNEVFKINEKHDLIDSIQKENFKSNRELFLRKVSTESKLSTPVFTSKKEKPSRPKSFYGGMFKSPLHLHEKNSIKVEIVSHGSPDDLLDRDTLKQLEREKEMKKDQEIIRKLRSSIERESSYSVANVEKLFSECEDDSSRPCSEESRNERKKVEKKEVQKPSRPRSLVHTLTNEWNSFIEEEDKKRDLETVITRKDLSTQKVHNESDIIKENAPKRKTQMANSWIQLANNNND
ncbi:trichohyalin-like isoform X2 [Xenia sp. Carnegie-2017]|uniref:trichohyalin-like isoform X2 n=1 Tax=Xenia sp. Carnegie-2017 TaxID=2897299 RepID=UPI001F04747B|nr:trichohyalin-like isoform X2 [Xenia sp. Carnegie-2017]